MEPTFASREAVERVAGLSLDEIRSLLEGPAGMIFDGEYGQTINLANAVRATYGLTTGAGSKSSQEGIETGPSDQKPTTRGSTFTEIEERSHILGPVTIGFTGETVQRPQVTSSMANLGLREWLSASESRVLWLHGAPNTSKPSDLSLTSAFVVSTIKHAKLPLIAHQCQSSGSKMDTMISMVYSVIIQLIWLLPEDFSTHIDLSPGRFSLLDRSVERLVHALLLMQDLLTLAPRVLVIVVDGIQRCEDRLDGLQGASMYLNFFIDILKNGGKGRVLKTLFTTDGMCESLWVKLELVYQDHVDLRSETGGTADHRRKGRNAMD